MDNINTEPNSYREAIKCQEKSSSKDLVIIEHLGLRNQTIWPGFLWYLTVPSCETNLPFIAHPLKLLKTARSKAHFVRKTSATTNIGIVEFNEILVCKHNG